MSSDSFASAFSTCRWSKLQLERKENRMGVEQVFVSAPVVTSLMSSAALWQPSTSR